MLLWASRRAILARNPTPLSRAIEFLTEDYTVTSFWWEPLEMCRKLALTGWVLLIKEESEQARVLVALLVSVAFVALTLSIKPCKRTEDGVLMTIVELALILVYICVLLIKSCDLSSLKSSRETQGSSMYRDDIAVSICHTYGLGETSDGVFQFFVLFAFIMILLQLLGGLVKLYLTGNTPKLLRVAQAHAVAPSRVIIRLVARKANYVKRHLSRALHTDIERLTPETAAVVLHFRIARRRPPPASTPEAVLPVAAGVVAELRIRDIFPRTTCFVQADPQILGLRWARNRFISLATVEAAELMKPQVRKQSCKGWILTLRTSPAKIRRVSHSISRSCSSSWRKTKRNEPTASTAVEMIRETSFKLTTSVPLADEPSISSSHGISVMEVNSARAAHFSPSASRKARRGVAIRFSGRGGLSQVLELSLPVHGAKPWLDGFRALLQLIPASASPAHWRWAVSCMAATSLRGATGFLYRANVGLLFEHANVSTNLSEATMMAAHACFIHADKLPRRQREGEMGWRSATPVGTKGHKLLNARQVLELLLQLCTFSPDIARLFDEFAVDAGMDSNAWLDFVRTRQAVPAQEETDREYDWSTVSPSPRPIIFRSTSSLCSIDAELAHAEPFFERTAKMCKHNSANTNADQQTETDKPLGVSQFALDLSIRDNADDLQTKKTLSLAQFALHLLSAQNDAVAPALQRVAEDGLDPAASPAPLAHHWTACSHNSFC